MRLPRPLERARGLAPGALLYLGLASGPGCGGGEPVPADPEAGGPSGSAQPSDPAARRGPGQGPGDRGGAGQGRRQPGGPPAMGLRPHDPNLPTPTLEEDLDPEPAFPAVAPDARGMVPVSAGWVELGPRRINVVPGTTLPASSPGGSPPAPGAAPGGQADADPGARAGRGVGGVAGVVAQDQLRGGGAVVPWRSTGGQQLEARRVWVAAFRMDRTEVTRAEYQRFVLATGYRPPHVDEDWAREGPYAWEGTAFPEGTGDHPVVLVSWYDAEEYCAWAGKRLPTEAEWQLAALGPVEAARIFPWGDAYGGARFNHGRMEEPNYDDSDGFELTSPVGSFPAGRSEAGLEDAFGNAWEFTSDQRVDGWELVEAEAVDGGWRDLRAPGPGLYVAVRGGSFFFDARPDPGGERNQFLPEVRRKTSGLRCAADA